MQLGDILQVFSLCDVLCARSAFSIPVQTIKFS
jgi:hypothetical protein